MSPPQIGRARASIESLRIRLHDVASLLQSASVEGGGDKVPGNEVVAIAIRAIEAVSEDLEAVCIDQLHDGSFQDAKALQAKSELDADEFDSEA